MADLTASDLVITIQKQRILRGSPGQVRVNTVKIVFGDGAKLYNSTTKVPAPTYPSWGMLKELEYVTILQNSITTVQYSWVWDFVNKRLIPFINTSPAHTHDLYIPGGGTTATTDLVHAPTGKILNQSTVAIEVTGKASTTAAATSGGIIQAAIGVAGGTEVANGVAIAEQTLYAQAWGY